MLAARAWRGGEHWDQWFAGELGFVELATVALLLPSLTLAIRACWMAKRWPPRVARPLRAFWLVFALGCLFFAGEEASWGQHWFGWATPEAIAAWNDQGETNLHNVSSWLDQKPRAALELWIVASLLAGLYRWVADAQFEGTRPTHWLLGWPHTVPAALMAEVVRLPERLTAPGAPLPALINVRLAEVQELFFAVFILVFAWGGLRLAEGASRRRA